MRSRSSQVRKTGACVALVGSLLCILGPVTVRPARCSRSAMTSRWKARKSSGCAKRSSSVIWVRRPRGTEIGRSTRIGLDASTTRDAFPLLSMTRTGVPSSRDVGRMVTVLAGAATPASVQCSPPSWIVPGAASGEASAMRVPVGSPWRQEGEGRLGAARTDSCWS